MCFVRAQEFLGMAPSPDPARLDNPHQWDLPVVGALTTPGGFLFGGAGLSGAVVALEAATGRPLVWATAQFLSYARPPAQLRYSVEQLVVGHQVTQARVMATDQSTGNAILTVNAALGRRHVDASGVWQTMPSVPDPSECPRRDDPPEIIRDTIFERLDLRLATARLYRDLNGEPGSGSCAMWVRVPEGLEMSSATVSLLGDWVPFGFGQALGSLIGGNSLDNTIRIANPTPTEWVLLDVQIHSIANGFGHGQVNLWSQDGTLCATASQSSIVRTWTTDQQRTSKAYVGVSVPTQPDSSNTTS
jgi:acyl-CoA thioesterase-2